MSKQLATGRRVGVASSTGRAAVAMAVEGLERRSMMAASPYAVVRPAPKAAPTPALIGPVQPAAKIAKAVSATATPAKTTATGVAPGKKPSVQPALTGPAPVITEFVASNANGITDPSGARPDWIEIQNQGDTAVDLAGWHLSDSAGDRAKWTFPASYTVAPGAYVIVYADSSTSTTPDSSGRYHTNFSLSADGENLSLSRPDGTVVSEYGPGGTNYPKQSADVSYGTATVITPTNLVTAGNPAKAIVPTNGTLDSTNAWTLPGYADGTWKSGTTGVGYDGGGVASTVGLVGRWDAQTTPITTSTVGGTTTYAWNSSIGGYSAVTTTASRRPTTSAINGHTALHFDGIDDRLRVANGPLSTANDFTVAFVFRTTSNNVGGATQWYNNAGIVDAEVGGVTNDWGLVMANNGQVGAGIGNPDTTTYSQTGLNDGLGHVVVFTKSGTSTALSIDGGVPIYGTAPANARSVTDMAFGSLQTNINFFNGDIGEIRMYNAAVSDDASRSLSAEMAAHWGTATAPGVYTPKIGLDLKTEMVGVASTANIRVPFTVSNPAQFDKLFLNMKYDDGFVAYLNGTEVARRNAPGGAITYTSVSNGARADSDALTSESIDISAFRSLLQGSGTNVLAIKALNVSANDSDLLVIPELVAAVSSIGQAYMATPSPGAANNAGYAGLVAPVVANVKHGFYTSPQSVTISSSTPGATIVYTTDGSTPTLDNGTQVLPANVNATPATTINIASTTVLRMAAFRSGYLQSTVSAESYMFLADILTQPEYKPAGAYWDVGLDTDIVNAQQTYSVAQALTAVPTVSLSIDPAAMFGTDGSGYGRGIYTHPYDEGDAAEKPVSVEYFDPNNANNGFFINAGIRVTGGVSRDPSRPKKSFKLYFRSEYGTSKLEYPVFGTSNLQQIFDHLSLRAGHNHTWANDLPNAADYLRDPFARATQAALTGHSAASDFVQLYINGQYWGLYNAAEDIDADWAEANYGGNGDDYDIIKPNDNGGIEADDGDLTAWNTLFSTVDAAYANGSIDSTEYANIASQVDVKALADYMLSVIYRGDKDAPVLIGSTTSPRNFIALHNRADPNGKFVFQTQDGELSIDDVNFDRTEIFGNQNPGRLYQQLRTNIDFRQLVADEAARLTGGSGPLTVAANQARYQGLMARIDKAIVGESARWGNALQATPKTRDLDWVNETNWILNTYFPQRATVVSNQLKTDFTQLTVLQPTVSVNGTPSTGGTITSGSSVTLGDANSPTGTIYYTLNGADPRGTNGALTGSAVAYTGAFTLPGARTLNARVLRNNVWSPITTLSFTLAPPSLRLSELMYHPTVPANGTFAKDEYEFIEVANTGATPIDLSGMTLNTGAAVTVANGTTLAAGARGVFVKNTAAFRQRYGPSAQILGEYTDTLSNSSERVTLFDPNSATNIFDVTYVDSWYQSTDGNGSSLVVNNLGPSQAVATVLGVASAWHASVVAGGTPGLDDVALPTVKLTGMTLDDGTAQRSRVRSATLIFDGTLTPANFAPGAITLTQTTGTISSWTAVVSGVTTPAAGQTAVTITFGGAAAVGGSIADGRYTLHVDGAKISDALGRGVDALGTGTAGSARDFAVARLFGDGDGDLGISINDFNALATAFGTVSGSPNYNATFDYDGDNGISINDFNQFASRFGRTI